MPTPTSSLIRHGDISIIRLPDTDRLLLTMPFSDGAPEALRKIGGIWLKDIDAWAIPSIFENALEELTERLVALAVVQAEINAANGYIFVERRLPRVTLVPVAKPEETAAPIDLGKLAVGRESDVAWAFGCTRSPERHWLAPSQEVADQVAVQLAIVREEEAILAAERKEAAELLAKQAAEVRAQQAAESQAKAARISAIRSEILAAWPTAKLVTVSSRLLNSRTPPTVIVTTPSGARMNVTDFEGVEVTKVSGKVWLVEAKAPRWPVGSGFKTTVTTSYNGKDYTQTLADYVPKSTSDAAEAA